jgi:hypothetical protein
MGFIPRCYYLASTFVAGSPIVSSNFVSFTLTADPVSFKIVAGSGGDFPVSTLVTNPSGEIIFS